MVRKGIQTLAALIGVFLICPPSFSQLNTGRISGVVTDQTGGAIVGAKVSVIDVARGETRPLAADASGQYAAPNLLPGTYTVRVEFMGFETVDRENVVVGAGGDVRVDVTMQPGQQTQTVTVTESIPIVNATNAQTGQTIQNNMVATIPLNGSNYRWYSEYVPGVMTQPGEGSGSLAANGGGTNWTTYMVDGLIAQSYYEGEAAVSSPGEAGDATVLPLDAIQEVAMVSNPKAEYGWNPNLTENIALKSGTNNIHGSAFAAGRDQDLDAKNNFAAARPPTTYERWGGSIGGPVKKDKLFFFAGYESFRLNVTNDFLLPNDIPSQSNTVASTSLGIPAAIAQDNLKGVPLNQLSLNMLGCGTVASYLGLTTTASVPSCTVNTLGAGSLYSNSTVCTVPSGSPNSENCSFPQNGGSDNGVGKLDYHINDHHTLNGYFFSGEYHGLADASTSITQPYWDEVLAERTTLIRGTEIWTPNSNWLNEFKAGWDGDHRPIEEADCSLNGSSASDPLGLTSQPGQFGAPNYQTAYGLYSNSNVCGNPTIKLSKLATLGFGNNRLENDSAFQFSDSVSYTRGRHQFKFGVDGIFPSFNGVKVQDTQRGTVTFGSSGDAAFSGATALEDFIAGDPSSETIKLGNPIRTVGWDLFALFAQDDWRIVPKLTLNVGLRWEMQTSATSSTGQLANFDPANPSGMTQNNRLWPLQSDFSPHLGFAWDVTGKGTTTVRSSIGFGYVLLKLREWLTAQTDDESAMATGATLLYANGTPEQTYGVNTVGNITSMIIAPAAISNGSVITNETLHWQAGSDIFNTTAFQCGDGLPVVGGVGNNPSPCTGYASNPNYKVPQVIHWNLNVQHAFTNTLSLDVGYIGGHASDISTLMDLNQPVPGVNGSSNEETRRPYFENCPVAQGGLGLNPAECFPWFAQILSIQPVGSSNYNSLQVYLNQRPTHGLTYTIGYTLSHAQGIVANGTGTNTVLNDNCPKCEYGNYPTDARNHFTITASYQIPGRKFPGQMLQGWAINSTVNILSALPLAVLDSSDDFSGTGENIDRWTLYGNAKPFDQILGGAGLIPCYAVAAGAGVTAGKFASNANCISVLAGTAATPWTNMPASCIAAAQGEPTGPTGQTGLQQLAAVGCYMVNGSAMVAPALGTYGNMTVNELRGKGFSGWNASITKQWTYKERYSAQFRADAFNLLNRTQYSGVGVNLASANAFGEATETPDVAKANPVVGSGGPREIQLGLKFTF